MATKSKIEWVLLGAIIGTIITSVSMAYFLNKLSYSTIEVYNYYISSDNKEYRSIEPAYKFSIGDSTFYPFKDWAIELK